VSLRDGYGQEIGSHPAPSKPPNQRKFGHIARSPDWGWHHGC